MLPSLLDLSRPKDATLLRPATDVMRDSELLSELSVCIAIGDRDFTHPDSVTFSTSVNSCSQWKTLIRDADIFLATNGLCAPSLSLSVLGHVVRCTGVPSGHWQTDRQLESAWAYPRPTALTGSPREGIFSVIVQRSCSGSCRVQGFSQLRMTHLRSVIHSRLDVHNNDGRVILQVVVQPLDGVEHLAGRHHRTRLPHELRHAPLRSFKQVRACLWFHMPAASCYVECRIWSKEPHKMLDKNVLGSSCDHRRAVSK